MDDTNKPKGRGTGRPFVKGDPRAKQWKPGQSGNPSGRPKGFGALAREMTADGQELLTFWRDVMHGKSKSLIAKLKASELLAAYGWGKPVQVTVAREEDVSVQMAQVRADVQAEVDDATWERIAARFAKRAEEVEE